ncbi:hypothetical protein ASE01_20030 [Nocardioides sp. Root190]|uniref:hypothetical protein n=1 Tax=Nocardioides sp. Root190 TaxID=1736488 RepID=UPI0006F970B8|nr:hypothetical protein [Nocardioides sp. Root190]KRB73067.1 hypothetical protein ASE01_20030 [Nocardioides sp. Root190]
MTAFAPQGLAFDEDSRLLCPHCKGDYVHVDNAYVAGRPREDSEVFPVHVDDSGQVRADHSVDLPIPEGQIGRRHVISLTGWCETCSARFALEFKQHKGQTYFAVRRQSWA